MSDTANEEMSSVDRMAESIRAKREAIVEDFNADTPPDEAAVSDTVEEAATEEVVAEEVEDTIDAAVEVAAAEGAADAAQDALGEDATEEEIDAAREEAKDEFYAGRFKDREQTERALAEQNQLIGRQGQELGELRKQLQERADADAQPDQLNLPEWQQWAANSVEENTGNKAALEAGALEALKSGGYAGYEIYAQEWLSSEDERDRASAIVFNNAIMMELARQPQAQTAAPAAGSVSDEAAAARAIVIEKRPDFEELAEDMDAFVELADPETRQWLMEQAQDGVAGKARALDRIYLEAAASKSDSRMRAQVEERRQRVLSAGVAKVGATVASSEATSSRTPLTEAEQRAIDYKNRLREHWGTEQRDE